MVQSEQVLFVLGIVGGVPVVVYVRQEDAFFKVISLVEGVVPVLCLDEVFLHKLVVGSNVEEFSHLVAEEGLVPWTPWKPKNSLVLSSNRNEVVHWRVVAPFSVASQELTSL